MVYAVGVGLCPRSGRLGGRCAIIAPNIHGKVQQHKKDNP